jgi:hypothetical protein
MNADDSSKEQDTVYKPKGHDADDKSKEHGADDKSKGHDADDKSKGYDADDNPKGPDVTLHYQPGKMLDVDDLDPDNFSNTEHGKTVEVMSPLIVNEEACEDDDSVVDSNSSDDRITEFSSGMDDAVYGGDFGNEQDEHECDDEEITEFSSGVDDAVYGRDNDSEQDELECDLESQSDSSHLENESQLESSISEGESEDDERMYGEDDAFQDAMEDVQEENNLTVPYCPPSEHVNSSTVEQLPSPSAVDSEAATPIEASTSDLTSEGSGHKDGDQGQLSSGCRLTADSRVHPDVQHGGARPKVATGTKATRSNQQERPGASAGKAARGRGRSNNPRASETKANTKTAARQPSILDALRPRVDKNKK